MERVFPEFGKVAEFELHFQPFQLYPHLTEQGINKSDFFLQNSKRVRPNETSEERTQRRQLVVDRWRAEGLVLKDVYGSLGGNVGNSFDAQRLILQAREQGRESECIEAIYKANHEDGLCLSDRAVLLSAAEVAGVCDAEEMLKSDKGVAEVAAKIQAYHAMGINAVPVVIINGKFPIYGFPDEEVLKEAFTQLITNDTIDIAGLQ